MFQRTVNDIHDQMKSNGEIGATSWKGNEDQTDEIRKRIQALQPVVIGALTQDIHQLHFNHLINGEFQSIEKTIQQ